MAVSTKPTTAWAQVNEQGNLVIPTELARRFGLAPGAKVRLDEGENFVRLHRPVTQLTKLYIEPTIACNLDCITCFRQGWNESGGRMSDETFEQIYESLKTLDPLPSVYFGGIGEPLVHNRTVEWVRRVKKLGVPKVEMITNGTLLDETRGQALIDAGLDMLWVSLDGATPESYADVRLGAELPQVIQHMRRFDKMRPAGHYPKPEIGVAFVAMKRNIQELPKVIKLGRSFRAKQFSVSNLQPATPEMRDERLYMHTLMDPAYMEGSKNIPRLSLPKMDINETTREALFAAFTSGCNITLAGNNWGGASDVCNFVESGSMSIAWDGYAAPCWALMHTHTSFLKDKQLTNHRHIIGDVATRSLLDLWLDPDYLSYRERLHNFGFAPCTFCGGCDLAEANQEDCFANPTPVCGVCLWAQGVIQCP
ncbi:MAG TPA: radical SAM protein [Anaerolineales bacterium]|jgi:MoaA/NifB/PqqE/SkfB family radical SAM enzyme